MTSAMSIQTPPLKERIQAILAVSFDLYAGDFLYLESNEILILKDRGLAHKVKARLEQSYINIKVKSL